MATTATRIYELPLGPLKLQLWRVLAGASDTTATFKSGLNNVVLAHSQSQDDSSHGVVKNSSDGTENTQAGGVYLAGVINSAICDVFVLGH